VDGIDISDLGGANDAVDLKIAIRTGSRADTNSLVRELDMEAVDIGLRIDGYGLDTQFLTSPDDAKCDLAAIGDQDFFEHGS